MAPKRPFESSDSSESSESSDSSDSSESYELYESYEEETKPEKAYASTSPLDNDKKLTSKKLNTNPQSSSLKSRSNFDVDSGATPNTSMRPIGLELRKESEPKAVTNPRSKLASSAERSGVAEAKRQATAANGEASSEWAKEEGPPDCFVSLDISMKSTVGVEKKLFQRLWNEDNETKIFKGMFEYTAKRRADPNAADPSASHEFVKNSPQVDGSKMEVMDKICELKKRYKKNAKRTKKGKDPTFSKPHA